MDKRNIGFLLISLGLIWMILVMVLPGIVAGLAVLLTGTTVWVVWSKRTEEFGRFITEVSGLFDRQPMRGIGIGIVLTVVYAFGLWVIYGLIAGYLVKYQGVHPRMASLIMTTVALPGLVVIWYLYQATGLPGQDGAQKGFRLLWVMILIFFGWWYWYQPNLLFDPHTGEARFWVAEESREIYFFPRKESNQYFSPATGEELRPGARADAKQYMRQPWVEEVMKTMTATRPNRRPTSSRIPSAPPQPLTPEQKLRQVPVGTWVQFGPNEWRVMAPAAPEWTGPVPARKSGSAVATSRSGNHNTLLETGRVVQVRNGEIPRFDLSEAGCASKWQFQSAANQPEEIIRKLH